MSYNIQLGGMCSQHFLEGNGNARLGNWPGETTIDAWVDHATAWRRRPRSSPRCSTRYCTGSNYCYVYTFSNGGAVISRTLSLYANTWNIGYVANAASNEGGSEIGGTGWIGEVFGGCTIAGHIGPSDHRNGWNHYETHGRIIGQIGGNGWLFPYAQSAGAARSRRRRRRASLVRRIRRYVFARFAVLLGTLDQSPGLVELRIRQQKSLRYEDASRLRRRRLLVKRRLGIAAAVAVLGIAIALWASRGSTPASIDPAVQATPSRAPVVVAAVQPVRGHRAAPADVTPYPELGTDGITTDDPVTAYRKANIYPPARAR